MVISRDYSRQNNQQSRVGLSVDERLFKFVYNNPQMADELDPDEEERYYEWADKKEQEDAKVAHKYNGKITSETDEIIDEAPAETAPIKVDGRVDPSSLKLLGTHTDGEPKPYGWDLARPDKPAITENLQGETPKLGIHTEGEPEPVGWALAHMKVSKAKPTKEVHARSTTTEFLGVLNKPSKMDDDDNVNFRNKDGENQSLSGKDIKEMSKNTGWGNVLAKEHGFDNLNDLLISNGYKSRAPEDRTSAKNIQSMLMAPSKMGNEDIIHLRKKDGGDLTLTGEEIKEMAKDAGWGNELLKKTGFKSIKLLLEAEAKTAGFTNPELAYSDFRKDKKEPLAKGQEKRGNRIYQVVFKDKDGNPSKWREYLVRTGEVKKLTKLEKDFMAREDVASAIGEFFKGNTEKTKQWGEAVKLGSATFLKKNGQVMISSTQRVGGAEPHQFHGGMDINASQVGTVEEQQKLIDHMLGLGYRVIDERYAWSDADPNSATRGILHFDKRPFESGEQHLVELTHKLDGEGKPIRVPGHTKYKYIKTA